MPPLIEAALPGTWQELEDQVAQILRECGYDVEVQKEVELAGRGTANIDVWADDHSSPRNVLAIECKQWRRRTNQSVVHAFRTVVGDSGANTGLIVSSAGFQRGAIEAAAYSNVRLLDWNEFQEMFAARWFMDYMSPTLAEATDALHEYTEPINSRIFRKADALPEDRQKRFKLLREQHFPRAATNFLFHPVVLQHLLPDDASPLPTLPLRRSPELPQLREMEGRLPDDVLDATALRPMMKAMIHHSQVAIAEFDEVFGERA
jgi:restriction system protein